MDMSLSGVTLGDSEGQGTPSVLQTIGLQGDGHDLVTEQRRAILALTFHNPKRKLLLFLLNR